MHDQMLSYDKILHQEDNRSNVDKKKSDKNVSSRKKSDQNIFLVRAERFTYGLRSSPTFIKKRLSMVPLARVHEVTDFLFTILRTA